MMNSNTCLAGELDNPDNSRGATCSITLFDGVGPMHKVFEMLFHM